MIYIYNTYENQWPCHRWVHRSLSSELPALHVAWCRARMAELYHRLPWCRPSDCDVYPSYPPEIEHSYGKWPIYRSFYLIKIFKNCDFLIAMLNYNSVLIT